MSVRLLAGVKGAVLACLLGGLSLHAAADPVTLTLYNGQHAATGIAIAKAFTDKTGIQVKIRKGGDGQLASQITEEGARSPADVIYTEESPPLMRLSGAGLLAPLDAGTLALALHTGGVLGRLFAEALENTPAEPAEALRQGGSGRVAAFAYGTLPAVWPQLVAYILYRWENNIRMASVLGFVGAGGLGQMLYFSLSLFQQAQAATVILAMLVLVLGVDTLSAWARQRWVSA